MVLSQTNFSEELGQPATGPIPPISWGYSPAVHQVVYNEDFVNKTLAPAKNNSKIKLTLSTYDDYLGIADDLQQRLSNTSVDLNVSLLSYDQPTSFDLLLAAWKVPLDPDQYFSWHSVQTSGNLTGYKSEKIDKLLEDGRATVSVEERKKIYANFQKILVDDVPAYFLYYPYIYTIRRK